MGRAARRHRRERSRASSSLGRLGLIVHATAGFCDPGWKGTLTLELNNLTRIPIKLYPGLPIAQLSFMTLDAPAERPYGSPGLGSHYQGQIAATESRYGGGPASGAFRPPMLTALITFAADEPNKTLFYICGGALVVWALVVSAIGIRAHASWPPTASAARA